MTELIWEGKYKDGKKVAPVRIALPFQTIETVNESTRDRQRSLDMFSSGHDSEWRNRLIWGDKKYVLPSLLPEFAGKINLVYIDPPFNVGADFSFTASIPSDNGTEDDIKNFVKEPSIIEQKAYRDTWGVDVDEKKRGVTSVDKYIKWFFDTAVNMRELLADGGAIYIHLDWRLTHYARVLFDEIFGNDNFMCQIIWKRITSGRKATSYKWLAVDDVILVYTKGEHKIKPQYQPYSDEYKKRFVYEDERGPYYWDNIGTYSLERLKQLEAEGRIKYSDNPNAKPRMKNYLNEGKGLIVDNVWTDISPVNSQAAEDTLYPTQKPEALLERIISASSNEGDLILDCHIGSGTTAAVAEKLNRKWIACDLGRFAIQTTRKRLLSITGVKPFIIQNLGKYERQAWQTAEFPNSAEQKQKETSYRRFILELYKAEFISGYTWLHGIKKGRMLHVGAVDAPVTLADIKAIATEVWKSVGKGKNAAEKAAVDVLGWDFALEVNEVAAQVAAEAQVDVHFKVIPREVLEKKAVEQGDIKFFELASLSARVKAKGLEATAELYDFVIPPQDVPDEIQKSISHWSQWVDYWAIDWDYKGDTFHNQWQSYRSKNNPKLELQANHTYEQAGEYQIVIKVIDILGNDTTKLLKVRVGDGKKKG